MSYNVHILSHSFAFYHLIFYATHFVGLLFISGYWPSYNIPFHENIYVLSGYGEMWKEYGNDFSYDLCPRAKIFRRDQADVKDLDSLKYIMRFNSVLLSFALELCVLFISRQIFSAFMFSCFSFRL